MMQPLQFFCLTVSILYLIYVSIEIYQITSVPKLVYPLYLSWSI
jgi:hypothetical protein